VENISGVRPAWQAVTKRIVGEKTVLNGGVVFFTQNKFISTQNVKRNLNQQWIDICQLCYTTFAVD